MTKERKNNNNDNNIKNKLDILFYNSDSTMDISRDVAKGFLILLTLGNNTDNNNNNNNKDNYNDDDRIKFAFAVLTDGNIIDICFGDKPQGGIKFAGSSYSIKLAKRTKQLLKDFGDNDSDNTNTNKEIAINAYKQCLQTVINCHDEIDELGIVSLWCWKARYVRKKTEDKLRESFSSLKQAISYVDSNLLSSL